MGLVSPEGPVVRCRAAGRDGRDGHVGHVALCRVWASGGSANRDGERHTQVGWIITYDRRGQEAMCYIVVRLFIGESAGHQAAGCAGE